MLNVVSDDSAHQNEKRIEMMLITNQRKSIALTVPVHINFFFLFFFLDTQQELRRHAEATNLPRMQ